MDPLAATETDSRQSDTEARTVQVAEVLLTYLDGLYHSDTARLAAVFHPAAAYATATGGELLHLTMDEYLRVVEQREAPATRGEVRQDRVVSIDFAGPVTALARVECAIAERHFTDFLSLVHVDGRWQIMAKVFHYDTQLTQPTEA